MRAPSYDRLGRAIERAAAPLARVLERALALAFIAAVALNFVNVVGRYGFGRLMLGADELQIYVLVFMAFLGAAVVQSRDAHLRMDVLARLLPERPRAFLRGAELAVLLAVAALVAFESARYAWQMFVLERRSDNAGIPMWIPHGAVAAGFALIALLAAARALRAAAGRDPAR